MKPGLEGLRTAIQKDGLSIASGGVQNAAKDWQVSLLADAAKLTVQQDGKFLNLMHTDGSPLSVGIKTGTSLVDRLTEKGSVEKFSFLNDKGSKLVAQLDNISGDGIFGHEYRGAASHIEIGQISGRGGSSRYINAMARNADDSIAGFVKDARLQDRISSPGWMAENSGSTYVMFKDPSTVHLQDLNKNMRGVLDQVSSMDIPKNPFQPSLFVRDLGRGELRTSFAQQPYSSISEIEPHLLRQQARVIGLPANASLDAVTQRMYQLDYKTITEAPGKISRDLWQQLTKHAFPTGTPY
jgi:hypothetical protein